MIKLLKRKLSIWLVFFFGWFFCSFPAFGYEQPSHKVLVLHSYHQGLEWTDNVTRGIQEVMRPHDKDVELFYEYLDTKRYTDSLYFERIERFYRERLLQNQFDLIIAVDDDALKFLLENREAMYQGIPVVFCGINKPIEKEVLEDGLITGITELPDFKATIDVMLKLHPGCRSIYVVNDRYTTTAKINRMMLDTLPEAYRDRLKFMSNVTFEQLAEDIKQIQSPDLILMLTFNKDKNQEFISYKEEARLVIENARVPVYSNWEFFLNRGIVGGKLIRGIDHGREAASMGLRILNGEKVADIPIKDDLRGLYMFDHHLLKKYKIAGRMLPEGSAVINLPIDFYALNKTTIGVVILVLVVLFVIIFVLSRSIRRRKRAEKLLLLKQEHLTLAFEQQRLMAEIVTYLNSTNDFTQVIDKVLNAITSSTHVGKVSLYRFTDNNKIDQIIGSMISVKGESIEEMDRTRVEAVSNIIGRILKNETIVSPDLSELNPAEQGFFNSRGIKSIMMIPIKVVDKINGMAGFAFQDVHEWGKDEQRLLSTMVRVIANAWERNFQMNQFLNMEKQHAEAVRVMERTSRLASIGVITGGITHEINQPLNAIKITTDTVLRKMRREGTEVGSYLVRKLEAISKGTERIDEIVSHMRNYWVNPVPDSDELQAVDLNLVVKNTLDLLRRQIRSHGIQATQKLAAGELLLKGNKMQIEQVVINLVVNSIHALEEAEADKKEIQVRTVQKEANTELIVEDNGAGIESSVGEQLFDPFYSTKKSTGGSGLGLAIVKTFVTKMNGNIRYENRAGGGVRFVITFMKYSENDTGMQSHYAKDDDDASSV